MQVEDKILYGPVAAYGLLLPDEQVGVPIDPNDLTTADNCCLLPAWVLDFTENTLTPLEQLVVCWGKLLQLPWATVVEVSARMATPHSDPNIIMLYSPRDIKIEWGYRRIETGPPPPHWLGLVSAKALEFFQQDV